MASIELQIAGYRIPIPEMPPLTYRVDNPLEFGARKQSVSLSFKFTTSLDTLIDELFGSCYSRSVYLQKFVNRETNTLALTTESRSFDPLGANPCQVYVNGLLFFDGFLTLENWTFDAAKQQCEYEGFFTADRQGWIEPASTLNLRDINMGEYCHSGAVVFQYMNSSTPAPTDDFVIAPVNYGNMQFDTGNSERVDINALYPTVRVINGLRAAFGAIGWGVDFPSLTPDYVFLFTNPAVRPKLAPLGGLLGRLVWDETVSVGIFPASPTVINNWVLDQPARPELFVSVPTNTYTGSATMPAPIDNVLKIPSTYACGLFSLRIEGEIFFRIGPGAPAKTFQIRVYDNTGAPLGAGMNVSTPSFLFGIGTLSRTFGQNIYGFDPAKSYVVTIARSGGAAGGIEYEYMEVRWKMDGFKFENLVCDVAGFMPNITLREAAADLMRIHNLYPVVQGKYVRFVPANQYFSDPNNAFIAAPLGEPRDLDWSGKATTLPRSEKFAITEMPSRYEFQYQQDNEVLTTNFEENTGARFASYLYDTPRAGGDNKVEVETKLFAPFINQNLTGQLAENNIPHLLSTDAPLPSGGKTDFKPRIAVISPNQYTTTMQIRINNNGNNLAAPAFRWRAAMSQPGESLLWPDLFSEYYRRQIELRTRARLVRWRLLLDNNDIAGLDFGRIVAILGHWYYLNKINQYNPNDDSGAKPSDVELIQIV